MFRHGRGHARLLELDRELAAKLEAAIAEPASRNEYEASRLSSSDLET
jgi:hypothetical protein